ncbi:UNVERIFIED_ORG: putative transcriptional regulator [Microbispora rosea subsp. rosea]
MGLSGEAVARYLDQWVLPITDLTDQVRDIRQALRDGRDVTDMLPVERPYPLPMELAWAIGATIP